MTKRVLVAGCSFSDPNFVSTIRREWRYDYPMWYDYVAKHYDWRIQKNVSVSGISNERIITYAMTELLSSPDHYELVMVELTGWTRCYCPTLGITHVPGVWPTRQHEWRGTDGEINLFNAMGDLHPDNLTRDSVFNQNLDSAFLMVKLCQELGKELVMFSIYEPKSFKKNPVDLMKCHHKFIPITKANERGKSINILGWPFIPSLNGKNLESVDYGKIAPEIGECHPNRKGMETIGTTVIEWLDQGKN